MKRFSEEPHNQRQIALMANEIDRFIDGHRSLGSLVKQLKALFWALESPDRNWSENFLSEWGALEATNALDIDRREQGPQRVGQVDTYAPSSALVRESVERIRKTVRDEIRLNDQ